MRIDEVLREGIQREASDVHIVCVLPPLLRINGILRKIDKFGDITPDRSREILLELLNEDQKQRLEKDLSLKQQFWISIIAFCAESVKDLAQQMRSILRKNQKTSSLMPRQSSWRLDSRSHLVMPRKNMVLENSTM